MAPAGTTCGDVAYFGAAAEYEGGWLSGAAAMIVESGEIVVVRW